MPHTYTLDLDRRIAFCIASGVLTDADLIEHQAELRSDPQFDPTFRQLWDLSQVESIAITSIAIHHVATASLLAPQVRRAFLVNDSAAFGAARTFAALYEIVNNDIGENNIRVFYDRLAALAWLEGDG